MKPSTGLAFNFTTFIALRYVFCFGLLVWFLPLRLRPEPSVSPQSAHSRTRTVRESDINFWPPVLAVWVRLDLFRDLLPLTAACDMSNICALRIVERFSASPRSWPTQCQCTGMVHVFARFGFIRFMIRLAEATVEAALAYILSDNGPAKSGIWFFDREHDSCQICTQQLQFDYFWCVCATVVRKWDSMELYQVFQKWS